MGSNAYDFVDVIENKNAHGRKYVPDTVHNTYTG
jgi:hypothetical protein